MRMNKDEFTTTLIARLGVEYEKSYEISATTVNKANQKCCGISFRKPNTNMAAIIYIDDLYAQYVEYNVCISDIMASLRERVSNIEFPEKSLEKDFHELCASFERIAGCLRPRLISVANNEEFLADKPHRRICDLAVYYAIHLGKDERNANMSATVNNTNMKSWQVTEEDLFYHACQSMDCGYMDIGEYLMGMNRKINCWNPYRKQEAPVLHDMQMYVLTNQDMFWGDAVVLNPFFMEWITNGQEVLLLPSSTHEWIMVLNDGNSLEEMSEMVKFINQTEVAESDFLSDSVYTWRNGELVRLS